MVMSGGTKMVTHSVAEATVAMAARVRAMMLNCILTVGSFCLVVWEVEVDEVG